MKADVLVAGGGLMGIATALELARAGKSVIVFEKDKPGRHASGNNSGGVRCQGRHLKEVSFAFESRKMWDHHKETVGSDCGFFVSPRLRLAENDDEMEILIKREKTLKDMGYTHEEVIDRDEVFRLAPNVAEHVVGGLVCRNDGLANPMLTTKSYAMAAERAGVKILTETRIVEASSTSSGFKVRTADGKTYEGEVMVNATGAWAGRFSAMLGDPIPVTAAAPTMMVTNRVASFMNGTSVGLTGRLLGLMAYQNGTVVVGGGYRSPLDLEKEKIWVDPMQMAKASKIMCEVMPKLKGAAMMRCWTAFEGCLKDKVPAVGESSKVSGLFHICGFTAHGFQLVPIMGRVMGQIIQGQKPELPLDDFRPDRFEKSAAE